MTCRFILVESHIVNRTLAFVSSIATALEKEAVPGKGFLSNSNVYTL
jgi:hypothetical protein